ncbi:FAD-dependent thymidylate synthase [Bacillus cereus]|uniref:FAD-dependent thymidylate synthase n=1 Tax=Bacillus cereus TaxID=1396 RepID=UPI000278FC72|nr:FAD-dependent thymidylate synthase [Bacillus cereus]EJQ06657.1 thymidylate synthase, flavin-dependent [Bacillus cereus BAG3O-2]EJQ27944.1 thymidylate synthase, flavin-dependent [Bacillus cereus BAG4O-1]PEW38743.1 thymidylate synthase (FAD) [Bacillus cereus]HDR8364018.1 FAD-dependent thymidylate synthase [Bacillus cereus]HDR8371611.1 FAD-dependent thymidylate synthase [Bacillus cereus]
MNLNLLAYTQLNEEFYDSFDVFKEFIEIEGNELDRLGATDGQAVALSAVRTCYSANKPSEIVAKEGGRYFGNKATDGGKGTEADRLMRHIVASKHVSTLEHITFTFAIEGVSRGLLAQLTRHRVGFSFSVQSQRYVRFGSDDKSGGFNYVIPEKVESKGPYAVALYRASMKALQQDYDALRAVGVPAEDARMVLPQAATTNLVMTVNLRSLLDFYAKRRKGNGAQAEIAELAEHLRKEVVKVEPWVDEFFEGGR